MTTLRLMIAVLFPKCFDPLGAQIHGGKYNTLSKLIMTTEMQGWFQI